MKLGKEDVRGSFWKTTFKNGDMVQVIGLRQKSFFNAIAVLSEDNRVIWMQPHCERGIAERKKYLFRNSVIYVVVIFLVATILFIDQSMEFWFYFAVASFVAVISLLITVGMSWKDLMIFARRMTDVGAALRIDSPEKINLPRTTKDKIKNGMPELPMGVYYF